MICDAVKFPLITFLCEVDLPASWSLRVQKRRAGSDFSSISQKPKIAHYATGLHVLILTFKAWGRPLHNLLFVFLQVKTWKDKNPKSLFVLVLQQFLGNLEQCLKVKLLMNALSGDQFIGFDHQWYWNYPRKFLRYEYLVHFIAWYQHHFFIRKKSLTSSYKIKATHILEEYIDYQILY